MGTFAHEFSHILGIGDNYNNPYSVPARRDYSGPWDMLSRGTFNGPGGPHSRWLIPGTAGSSMGAEHMLREKMKLGIVDPSTVLNLSRDGVTGSGVVVAKVKAREVQAKPGELTGVNLVMGDDRDPACDVSTDPLCDGGGYNNYTVEVVDRMGFDSFTPDSGVLLSKTKDRDTAPFIWVVDAHPEDIDKVDFVLPNGTPQKMTIGDYRQLSDALFHAGTDSGSQYEYVDQANRLHFYVLDIKRDASGVLSYTVAVRSLDGAGTQQRGVRLSPGVGVAAPQHGYAKCTLPLRNTGTAGTAPRRGRVPAVGDGLGPRLVGLAAQRPRHREGRAAYDGAGLRQARGGRGPSRRGQADRHLRERPDEEGDDHLRGHRLTREPRPGARPRRLTSRVAGWGRETGRRRGRASRPGSGGPVPRAGGRPCGWPARSPPTGRRRWARNGRRASGRSGRRSRA
jgi:hypothetical protein